MKYSRISNDTSHLKHYIKLVAGGVDKDCQGPGLHVALVEEVSKIVLRFVCNKSRIF